SAGRAPFSGTVGMRSMLARPATGCPRGAGCVVSSAMDVDELRHALGGVVLEAAYLERVLRTAFSALVGSKYASVVDDRLTVAALIEDCERITRHHTDIPGPVRVELLEALKACHEANRERNRVIHDAWAARPGDVTVTLAGSRTAGRRRRRREIRPDRRARPRLGPRRRPVAPGTRPRDRLAPVTGQFTKE